MCCICDISNRLHVSCFSELLDWWAFQRFEQTPKGIKNRRCNTSVPKPDQREGWWGFGFSIRHVHSAESTKRTFSRTVSGIALLHAAAPGPPRVSFFAALAALLAGVGIYGAISFSVAQRTREFGLLIAPSAGRRAIISMTLARTARLALSGAACGLGLALMLGALLKTALYLAPGQHAGVLHWFGIHDPPSVWPQPRPRCSDWQR
jgi:hypothetical protein